MRMMQIKFKKKNLKNVRGRLVDYCPKQDDHTATNLERRNK